MCMKVCCVVETVYQLLNILNLRLSSYDFINAEMDLYVRKDHFTGCKEYCDRISEKKVFHSIRYFKFKPYSKLNVINRIKQIQEYLFAEKFLTESICDAKGFQAKDYDVILTPNGCQFFKEAMFCCSKAKVFCYEDGLLSYNGTNWIAADVSPLSKVILKVVGKKKKIYPERVYIYNRNFFEQAWDANVIEMTSLSETIEKEKDLFNYVFGMPISNYNIDRIVFLSQPNPVPYDISKRICDAIEQQHIVRYHPRDAKDIFYSGEQDRGSSQWELICANSITDKHILIGAYSSGIVSPKWSFNKEPYIIFTYKIYGNSLPNKTVQTIEMIIEKTRSIYRKPEKVIVVETINQMKEIVEKLCKRE